MQQLIELSHVVTEELSTAVDEMICFEHTQHTQNNKKGSRKNNTK